LYQVLKQLLHRNAIIAAYQELNINLAVVPNFDSFDDVPREIARLVHEASESTKAWNEVPETEQEKKESRAKRVLCSSASRFMNRALFNEIDPDGNLLQWFDDIRNLLA